MDFVVSARGDVRAIWDDSYDARQLGMMPRRASRVEVIEDGPYLGEFHVDFTLLAQHTSNPEYQVCLVQRFRSYKEAVAAEVVWLREHFLGLPPTTR